MNRAVLVLACFVLGCSGKLEPQKSVSENADQPLDEDYDPTFQSILDWDFANWPKVTEDPVPMDPKYSQLCMKGIGIDRVRSVEESKEES